MKTIYESTNLRITIMAYFDNDQWKQKAASKTLTARDFFMRALHKALDSKAENKADVFRGLLLKYFSPITNANKLANGMTPWKSVELLADQFMYNKTFDREQRQFVHDSGVSKVFDSPLRDPTYVYFFTRQDISYEQQLVQTAHAASMSGATGSYNPTQQHFIVFGVPDLKALTAKYNELEAQGIELLAFREPDIGNEMTSFFTPPIRGSFARRKGYFKNETLLRQPQYVLETGVV